MISDVQQRGSVSFPAFTGERIYMRPFSKDALPDDLRRWQPTVDAMLDGIEVPGVAYLMVDQARVRPGSTHRRGGVHVDGYWYAGINHRPAGHGGVPLHWAVPARDVHRPVPQHRPAAPSWHEPFRRGHLAGPAAHDAEGLILATNILGCVAYRGAFDRPAEWNGGDCSAVDTSRMDVVELEPYRVWAGETGAMLHESIAHDREGLRTVVRINVPGWAP